MGVVNGPAGDVLSRERVMLNLIQRLCGIATISRKYADLAEPYNVKILDTRKTTPGLRLFEKYAVNKIRDKFSKMKKYEIFKEIYLNQLWSPEDKKVDYKFYSGTGSYLPELVNDYFVAIENFFSSL